MIALAARRGEKGFSSVLAAAIEQYLEGEQQRLRRREDLLALGGSLSREEAADLRDGTRAIRESWR